MNPPPLQMPAQLPGGATTEIFCDTCGAGGAVKIGDRYLCEKCYAEAGSCCLEFGGLDLTDPHAAESLSAGSHSDSHGSN